MHRTKLYIDKTFVAPVSNDSFAAINPATEAAFAEVAAGGAADVDLAVCAARRAFDDGPWPQMSASERAGALRRIAKGITKRMSEIAALETRDNGKPLPETEWDVGDVVMYYVRYPLSFRQVEDILHERGTLRRDRLCLTTPGRL